LLQQVEDEVARVEDVVALPRLAQRVGSERRLAGDDVVMREARALRLGKRRPDVAVHLGLVARAREHRVQDWNV
jgi:hypothetical protein